MGTEFPWIDYELIDSGGGRKFERYGKYRLVRPDPQAIWQPALSEAEWRKADAEYARSGREGEWTFRRSLPESWTVSFRELVFRVKPTSFKHTGLFPEQAANWLWLQRLIAERGGGRVLNLFAYTGGATLAAASAGAEVAHVDASRGAIKWARENQEASGLAGRKIRWIQDDVSAFVARETRRGSRYDAVVMDPPPYGRGAAGELWKIETDLAPLVAGCMSLLSDRPLFFLVNTYASGYAHMSMRNFLEDFSGRLAGTTSPGGILESGDLLIPQSSSRRVLPCGIFARWASKNE
jgi:23S rRNA (cytosine1962-C5)-methyltransferase